MNNVKSYRLNKFWSQEDLAAKSGVSRLTISKIERNHCPNDITRAKLAHALGKSVKDLFGKERKRKN